MPRNDFANQLQKRARKAIRLTLNEIGRESVKYIRSTISTRVVYVAGFGYVRSEPGEPPYRQYGDLWKSIKYKVEPGATATSDLVVYTTSTVAVHLEYGTVHMEPRPFWEDGQRAVRRLMRQFKSRLAQRLAAGAAMDAEADFPADDSGAPDAGPG